MPNPLIEGRLSGGDVADNGSAAIGAQLARAIAAGDRAGVLRLLAPTVEFHALTPSRVWESTSPAEVADIVLGTWFGGDRRIDGIDKIDLDDVADRQRVGYRFRATTPEGEALVEQQAYLAVDGGEITSLRILCSGFRPVTTA